MQPTDADDSRTQQREAWSQLMVAGQAGDAAAYRQLLREVTPFIRHLARRRGLAAPQCEDVAQDVLLTVHRVRHTYDQRRPFVPWLVAIAQRRMIDLYRRDRRVRENEQSNPDLLETFAAPVANDTVDIAEQSAWLRQAIADLPAKQREALELVKLGELSVAEAAARSGQSPGAVKVNVHRAIKALQRLVLAP